MTSKDEFVERMRISRQTAKNVEDIVEKSLQTFPKGLHAQLRKKLKYVPQTYKIPYLDSLRGKGGLTKAVKMHCLECVAWVRTEVTLCTCPDCPLWKFRPYQKGGDDGED